MPILSSKIGASHFAQLLANEVPRFDEMILKDIRSQDSWIAGSKKKRPSLNDKLTWISFKLMVLCRKLTPRMKKAVDFELGIYPGITTGVWPMGESTANQNYIANYSDIFTTKNFVPNKQKK